MEKTVFFAFVLLNTCFLSSVHCAYYTSQPIKPVQEQKTNLKFYIHDILSGTKPSAVPIARPSTANPNDPLAFGTTYAIDDPLTEGPEITSNLIGSARGLYVLASQDKTPALVMYIDLGFTSGLFNGSSLSVFSRNPITENPREMAVVGGRGRFRYAKGFVLVRTQYLNLTNGDAVLEYNIEVVHP